MNNSEAADIVEFLVGAFPGTYFQGPTAEVFVNSLTTSDYEASKKAAVQWVQTMEHFPTIAELNRLIRGIRDADRQRSLPEPEVPAAFTREQRRAAFTLGYRQARVQAGDTDPEIADKLERKFAEIDRLVGTRGERKLTGR